ncbi:hypothetical protein FXF51_32855 [Nonomuraea sp. PA05]|nr:hypothetical protein FXF51_32855 [Nonomuraea sp. PA05]
MREELGHAVSAEALGPVVAMSEGGWSLDGRRFHSHDSYFMLRVGAGLEVDTSGMDAEERETTDRFQWWAGPELAACAEPVVPRGLGALVARLVAGDVPAAPVVLPWHLP